MTRLPMPRPEQLFDIQNQLSVLLEARSAFLRGVQQGRLPSDAGTLTLAAQTYSGLLSDLDDLGKVLNALSLEPLARHHAAQLEDTFTLLERCRAVIRGVLGEVARRSVPHLGQAPGPTLKAPLSVQTRFPGDWALPEGGVLLAVWWVPLPGLEPPPIPGGHLYRGGDFLGVAYRLRGDPAGVQRLSSRFRHARGEDRRLEHAPWMDGDKVGTVEEVIRTFTQVADLLGHQANQSVIFQELRLGAPALRRLLEREGPRWGAFVSG